jgi:thiamine-monophosphate kinase
LTRYSGIGARLGPGREFDRIRKILGAPSRTGRAVWVGPGDDAAVLDGEALEAGIVLSTDLSIEGVHFRLDWISAKEAGYRAAAAGVSDLAAMGAEPVGVLASVAAPGDGAAAEAIMAGVDRLVRDVGADLLGGDLTRSPGPLLVDVISVGHVSTPLLRSAVEVGDELWVTGTLGGAAGAVALWSADRPVPPLLRNVFVGPTPRTREARWLAERGVKSAIDLSDGLAGDAGHLASASDVRIVIAAEALPLHPVLRECDFPPGVDPLGLALHGGEDYELLISGAPGLLGELREAFTGEFGLPLSEIGNAVAGDGVWMSRDGSGSLRQLARGGFDHFGEVGEPGATGDLGTTGEFREPGHPGEPREPRGPGRRSDPGGEPG